MNLSSLSRQLISAVEKADSLMVIDLLDRGADIHALNDHSLMFAANYGYLDIVSILLDRGADINAQDGVVLSWAAMFGHLEVVKLLLDRGADVQDCNNLALRQSAKNGHIEVVAYLLDHGADMYFDNDRAILDAVEAARIDVVSLFIERGFNPENVQAEDLETMVEDDRSYDLSRLIGLFPHISKQSLLEFSMQYDALNSARMLIDLGVKPDMKLEMSDGMRDMLNAYRQKEVLIKKVKASPSSGVMEYGL